MLRTISVPADARLSGAHMKRIAIRRYGVAALPSAIPLCRESICALQNWRPLGLESALLAGSPQPIPTASQLMFRSNDVEVLCALVGIVTGCRK